MTTLVPDASTSSRAVQRILALWHPVHRTLGVAGWLSVVVLVLMVTAAILAPVITTSPPSGGSLIDQFLPPSPQHPLGTDENGNDIFSRLVYGARPSLLAPVLVVALAMLVGVPLAIASALRGGWLDTLIGRTLDLVFAFPLVLVASILVLIYGRGLVPSVVAVAIAFVPWIVRITRAAALRERHKAYIRACEIQGLSGLTIAVRHLLPNISRLIVAQSTIAVGYALVDLAALSFLGLGIRPPSPDWGTMIGNTNSLAQGQYTSAMVAASAVVIVVMALSVLGNRISDETRTI